MLAIHVDNLSDLTVVECKGRIVRNEEVFKLRDVVLTQAAAASLRWIFPKWQRLAAEVWGRSRFSIAGHATTIFNSSCLVPPDRSWKGWYATAQFWTSRLRPSTK